MRLIHTSHSNCIQPNLPQIIRYEICSWLADVDERLIYSVVFRDAHVLVEIQLQLLFRPVGIH